MSRPSLKQLAFRKYEASRAVPKGSFWRHQASGDVYQITGHTIRESDGVAMISYRPVAYDGVQEPCGYGERPAAEVKFSRPLSEWSEHVILSTGTEGTLGGPRFKQVVKTERWTDAH